MNGYLCKITVKYTKPKTWREVIIPEKITFGELHNIIQIIMGLSNYHLYLFKYGDEYILDYSLNDMDMWDVKTKNSTDLLIDDYFFENNSIFYRYDFGDEWECDIQIKEVIEYYRSFPTIKKYRGEYNLMEDCRAAGGWNYAMELITDPDNMEDRIPAYDYYADYLSKFDKDYVQDLLIDAYGDGKYMNGYDIKIRLDDFKPITWVDLIIPSGITFKELDDIILTVMNFSGFHLSAFTFSNSNISIEDESRSVSMSDETLDSNTTIIDDYFEKNNKIMYEYDFGDGWSFTIEIKKSVDYDKPYATIKRSKCKYLPIEDCGGCHMLEKIIKHHEKPNGKHSELYESWKDSITEFDEDYVQMLLEEKRYSRNMFGL